MQLVPLSGHVKDNLGNMNMIIGDQIEAEYQSIFGKFSTFLCPPSEAYCNLLHADHLTRLTCVLALINIEAFKLNQISLKNGSRTKSEIVFELGAELRELMQCWI